MSALHTIETRWFFDDQPFPESDYFGTIHRTVERVDWYALPCDSGCGIKIREGRLETKLRSQTLGKSEFDDDAVGIVETWSKWSVPLDPNDSPSQRLLLDTNWLPVAKLRYVRRFEVVENQAKETLDRPVSGCSFEITKITIHDQTFWTTGFEAVGSEDSMRENLNRVFECIHNEKRLPQLPVEQSIGYPHWLNQVADRIVK